MPVLTLTRFAAVWVGGRDHPGEAGYFRAKAEASILQLSNALNKIICGPMVEPRSINLTRPLHGFQSEPSLKAESGPSDKHQAPLKTRRRLVFKNKAAPCFCPDVFPQRESLQNIEFYLSGRISRESQMELPD